MSNWNNNYNRGGGNWNNRGGGNWNNGGGGNWNNGGGGNWNNRGGGNRPMYKKSSYKCKQLADGAYVCSGFLKNKAGLWKLYARPYKGTHESTSKNGNKFLNLFVTLTNTTTFEERKTSGLLNLTNKKLIMKDLNLLGTPNGGGQTSSGKSVQGSIVRLNGK